MGRNVKILMSVALAAAGAAVAVNGCSRGSTQTPGNAGDGVSSTGGVALQLGPGVNVDTVLYTITGPSGFTRAGSFERIDSSMPRRQAMKSSTAAAGLESW